MGAKAPSKLKLRRPTYKCDVCDRKFLSAQALKTHRICMHEMKSKRKPMKDKAKLNNLLGKAIKKPSDPLGTTSRMSTEKVQTKSPDPDTDVEKSKPFRERKIEFECPQCLNLFAAYFTAYRHIQKNHCINDKGKKVSPNAADLIKPVRIETCLNCDMRVRRNSIHLCSERHVFPNVQALTCVCVGCKQRFSSIQLFDLHVSGVHCDGIESYFFPTLTEFTSWKDGLEAATDTKYLVMGQCSTKQMYRCTCLPPTKKDNDNVAYFCPATIVTREYSKGIQIHFYKQHHGHRSKEYNVPEEFKKYTITTLMQNTKLASVFKKDTGSSIVMDDKEKEDSSKDPLSDDTDLYVQFKTLMDSLVIEAAKMNIQTLKVLISKALEMSNVVSQYVEDEELGDVPKPTYLNKNMSDNEIVDALQCFKKNMKRKLASPALEMKNEMDDSEPAKIPKIVNTFSLAEEGKEIKTRAKNKVLSDMKHLSYNSEENRPHLNTRDKLSAKKSLHIDKPKISTLKRKNTQNVMDTPERNVKRRISVRKDVMTEIKDSPKPIKAVVDSSKSIKAVVDSSKSIKTVVDSSKSIKAVVDSSKSVKAVVDSSKSIKTVVNSPKSFKAIEDSPKPIKAVVDSSKSIKTVVASPKSMKTIIESPNSISSFNDSYKDFVVKNFKPKKKTEEMILNNNKVPTTTELVKTVTRAVSAVKNDTTVPIKQDQNKAIVENIVPIKKLTPINRKINKTAVQVSKTNGRAKKVSKKKVMKTKIGQYKPSLSPTKTEPVKMIRSPYGTQKVKPDFEYEVKKQENDCNILILKF